MGMSNLTAGLLGGFTGALGAREQAYQSDLEYTKKLSLEEYKHQKQVALENLRSSNAGNLATTAAGRSAEQARLERVAMGERNDASIAGRKDVAGMQAEERKVQKRQITKLQTEGKDAIDQAALSEAQAALGDPETLGTISTVFQDITSPKAMLDKVKTLSEQDLPGKESIMARLQSIIDRAAGAKLDLTRVQTDSLDPLGELQSILDPWMPSPVPPQQQAGPQGGGGLIAPEQAAVPAAPPPGGASNLLQLEDIQAAGFK